MYNRFQQHGYHVGHSVYNSEHDSENNDLIYLLIDLKYKINFTSRPQAKQTYFTSFRNKI